MQSEAAGTPPPPIRAGAAALLVDFLAHLTNERRLSPHTIASYERDISTLLELAAGTPLAELQIQHVRRFIAHLHSRGLDGKSLARMLSAWRGFYRFLARDHAYTSNPCIGLRAPKSAKNLPQELSPDEAARLM